MQSVFATVGSIRFVGCERGGVDLRSLYGRQNSGNRTQSYADGPFAARHCVSDEASPSR